MKLFISTLVMLSALCLPVTSFSQSAEIKELIEDAKNGSKSSMYNLGVRYGEGDGVKKNMELANQYYEEAAKRNYAPAQNNLGWSYREGLGVKKNTAIAIYWFRLSALQNNSLALQNLAEMYQAGEGVKKNLDVAEELFTLCAVQPIVDDVADKESGSNNAIVECRKELGKLISLRSENKQAALKRASFWYRASLVENNELKEDSEIGVRARKVVKDTLATLELIDKNLTTESKKWVEESLKNWGATRLYLLDTTSFPLTVLDCSAETIKL
jgi:Sel1 repeat